MYSAAVIYLLDTRKCEIRLQTLQSLTLRAAAENTRRHVQQQCQSQVTFKEEEGEKETTS